MLKYLSLFSGIGAFEKALQNLEIPYELVGYSEIDKYASRSYATLHNVSEDMNLGDIQEIDENTLPNDIDLITYGFPCQDISIAGKGTGFIDENNNKTRSGLFFDALRIIEKTQPKVAIAENVKNLTSKKFKTEFEIVLDSLNRGGYNNYYKVLNAKDFGIPQNRERVFIISIRKDIDNGLFQFPNGFPLELTLKDMLDDIVDEKYFLKDEYIERYKKSNFAINSQIHITGTTVGSGKGTNSRHWVHETDGIIGTISASDYKQPKQIVIRKFGIFDTEKSKHQAGSIYDGIGISPTLDTAKGGYTQPIVEVAQDSNLKLRKLTPKEYWRLMGFTDGDFEKVQKINSNTQLYKQAGNSIVVNVLEELFKNLFDNNIL